MVWAQKTRKRRRNQEGLVECLAPEDVAYFERVGWEFCAMKPAIRRSARLYSADVFRRKRASEASRCRFLWRSFVAWSRGGVKGVERRWILPKSRSERMLERLRTVP